MIPGGQRVRQRLGVENGADGGRVEGLGIGGGTVEESAPARTVLHVVGSEEEVALRRFAGHAVVQGPGGDLNPIDEHPHGRGEFAAGIGHHHVMPGFGPDAGSFRAHDDGVDRQVLAQPHLQFAIDQPEFATLAPGRVGG